MRRMLIALVGLVLMVLLATSVVAERKSMRDEDSKTARADVGVISAPAIHSAAEPALPDRSIYDIRESVSLVIVGGMLLGLAAAVRRTV